MLKISVISKIDQESTAKDIANMDKMKNKMGVLPMETSVIALPYLFRRIRHFERPRRANETEFPKNN